MIQTEKEPTFDINLAVGDVPLLCTLQQVIETVLGGQHCDLAHLVAVKVRRERERARERERYLCLYT